MGKTLFDKVWDSHVVDSVENGPQVLYIDQHLIHEVTSPQAFEELENRDIPVLDLDKLLPQQIIILQQQTKIFQSKMSCQKNN